MKKSRSYSHHGFSCLALQSKINFFKEKYNQSQQKFKTKYAWQLQSSTKKLPNKKNSNNHSLKKIDGNNLQTPTKSSKKTFQRLAGSGIVNPEVPISVMESSLNTKLLKDLNNQAKEMTGYAEENKQLLKLKSEYENRIRYLKMELARQNKQLSYVECNNGLLRNKIQQTQKRFNEAHGRSVTLQDNIAKTSNEINQQKRRKMQNQAQINYNNQSILRIEEHNRKINDIQIPNTRISLLKQDDMRLQTQEKLLRELKVMQNDAILYKQLFSQKQNIESNLKKFVEQNKIEQQYNSRLSLKKN